MGKHYSPMMQGILLSLILASVSPEEHVVRTPAKDEAHMFHFITKNLGIVAFPNIPQSTNVDGGSD